MARPPDDEQTRVMMSVRVSPAARDWVRAAATVRGEPDSETLRTMFTYAARYMPPRWRPDDETRTAGTTTAGLPSMAEGRELRNARKNTQHEPPAVERL